MSKEPSGTLYTKNGFYYARIYYYVDGVRKTKDKATKIAVDGGSQRKTARNERAANRFLHDFLGEFVSPGTIILDSVAEPMVADTAKVWLEHLGMSKAPGTLSSYAYIVRDISLYFTEIKPIRTAELTPSQVEAYLEWERQRRQPDYVGKYKVRSQRVDGSGIENTVKHRYTVLRSILQYAKREGIVNRNVASLQDSHINAPRPQRQVFFVLSVAEANVMIDALATEPLWFKATVLLGLMLGLRRSEIIGIKFSDIDWETGVLTIRRTATQQTLNGKNTVIIKPFTKNRNPKTFQLTKQLFLLFRELLESHQDSEKQFGSAYDNSWDGFVIRYEDGKLVPPNTVTQRFSRFIKEHNFKSIRFHDLRHSCASILYANGIDIKTIQEILGHAHLTTTTMYTHTLIDRKTFALEQMHEQFLASVGENQGESEN